ncbi:MAG: isoprenyl transferase [Clostridia bacterium]|nr:isoprenyl transferase [Clostridia bacterium]
MLKNLVQFLRGAAGDKEPTLQEQELMKQVDMNKIPVHIAIIMDGNGRWATKRGLPRGVGHRAGVESLREAVNTYSRLGVNYLTVYAFSTENWKRPQEEVNILMDLLVEYLHKEIDELHRKNVFVNALGRLEDLPVKAQEALNMARRITAGNNGLTLNICLNYGGRTEITEAFRAISVKLLEGQIKINDINENLISEHLYTSSIPDPDLLIRPAGELRVSNFLLWQLAYTEFWLTTMMWPDFRRQHLLKAVIDWQRRNRRFGGI